jgi:hypothetical protein
VLAPHQAQWKTYCPGLFLTRLLRVPDAETAAAHACELLRAVLLEAHITLAHAINTLPGTLPAESRVKPLEFDNPDGVLRTAHAMNHVFYVDRSEQGVWRCAHRNRMHTAYFWTECASPEDGMAQCNALWRDLLKPYFTNPEAL